MIIRVGILEKSKNMSYEQFYDYWLNTHGKLVKENANLKRYEQNHVIDRQQRGISFPRTERQIDGFSQLWFDSIEHMNNAFNEDVLQILGEDEKKFIESVPIVVTKQNVIIEPPTETKHLLKRMTLIKRRKDISVEKFLFEWEQVHSELVKKMPGVVGYKQNVIIDRIVKGKETTYEDVPYDGLVEFWFESKESIETAFNSPEGKKTMQHAETFLEEITTFLVENHKVI